MAGFNPRNKWARARTRRSRGAHCATRPRGHFANEPFKLCQSERQCDNSWRETEREQHAKKPKNCTHSQACQSVFNY